MIAPHPPITPQSGKPIAGEFMDDKILIIEDEAAIADTLLYALHTEGFDAHWCSLASEGMDWLQGNPVDLVILDIGLPDENGFELCRRIRRFSSVPIMFLTARKEEIDRIVGLEIGADDYVVKPFSPREICARVKAILRRTRPAAEPVEDTLFHHDPQQRRIRYQRQWLDLTRYEYLILGALLRHPGHVLSRDQLMDAAWEDPGASLDRAVDTHIKGIRMKLKKISPDVDPIVTHRGLGYSLNAR